jgi:hypothetical protein
MTFKPALIKFHRIISQFGLDPLRFIRSFASLPAFLRDYRKFRAGYLGDIKFNPCLHDRFEEGGTTKSEYFWQDLIVARWIHDAKPNKHVDVGSRVDGFVAHVASFREIEVLDVRPISTQIPGITFKQANLMSPESISTLIAGGGYCDSLSCLHVLEHFGLGRYGDPVDTQGYARGLANLAALLKPEGRLYLSTPMGRERVEFNANWVFAPQTIVSLAASHQLQPLRFLVFTSKEGLVDIPVETIEQSMHKMAKTDYQLGIIEFVKRGDQES